MACLIDRAESGALSLSYCSLSHSRAEIIPFTQVWYGAGGLLVPSLGFGDPFALFTGCGVGIKTF